MAAATEKPKRPMSAYLLWLNNTRGKIKEDNPGLKVTEVAKKAGELWRAMPDKTEWETRAAEAKEQYARDLDVFYANGGNPPVNKRVPKRGRLQYKPPKDDKPKRRAAPAKVKKEEPSDEEDDDGDDDEADSE